jgi:outer membrane protein TolC
MFPPKLIPLLALACACAARAAPNPPLVLDEVLAMASRAHPELAQAEAQVALARADQQYAESMDDFRISLDGTLRSGRNEQIGNRFEPDHAVRLNARKLLWDAGRRAASGEAARLDSQGREAQLLATLAQRRLTLMARFFDVLLADLQYTADNEYMAVAYVAWDHAKDRQQLGELTQPALAELEARFQDARVRRNDTLRRAKEKRALLANTMNRPGELPAELTDPDLHGNDRPDRKSVV